MFSKAPVSTRFSARRGTSRRRAETKVQKSTFVILEFGTVAAVQAHYSAAFHFVRCALWFVASRTCTLSAARSVTGLSTATAIALGYSFALRFPLRSPALVL
ncbi:hypothetical protein OI25_7173 [Paraburkholderia fungorum]|jgi:hypothetical protein|uniref:Uncharacterized protein n=1 Tax=Paraburkholderia fungorum TaxID=134537 RepID=A0AAP5QHW9_9BURK|nr:hypothetical protein [Paraburkholderia fungorum]AJZ57163.1 hypothetical protein OI25_7173 [Paraburkholderia fungorum]MDT8842522.1 hypothetical protein [Paraburkholderia fungorum]